MTKAAEAFQKFWPILAGVLTATVAIVAFAIRGEGMALRIMDRVDGAIQRAEEDRRWYNERLKDADEKAGKKWDEFRAVATDIRLIAAELGVRVKGLEDRLHTVEARTAKPPEPGPGR